MISVMLMHIIKRKNFPHFRPVVDFLADEPDAVIINMSAEALCIKLAIVALTSGEGVPLSGDIFISLAEETVGFVFKMRTEVPMVVVILKVVALDVVPATYAIDVRTGMVIDNVLTGVSVITCAATITTLEPVLVS